MEAPSGTLISSLLGNNRIKSQQLSFLSANRGKPLLEPHHPQPTLANTSSIWFDAAHQHFLILSSSQAHEIEVISCLEDNMRSYIPFNDISPQIKRSIISMRLSLDKNLLAVQISTTNVIIFDLSSNSIKNWSIQIKLPSGHDLENKILHDGLIWSEHGGGSQDLILVTLRGLELYKISPNRNQCKLSRVISQNCYSFWYEPNHRMILLATPVVKPNNASPDNGGKTKFYNSLSMSGIFLRCDKVDHLMPKLELPPPERSPKFEIGSGVSKDNVNLVTLYGKPYCIALHKVGKDDFLILYHITKTAVTRTCLLALNYPTIYYRVSVQDNILICHCFSTASHKTVLFDINVNSHSKIIHFDRIEVPAILPLCSPSDIILIGEVQNTILNFRENMHLSSSASSLTSSTAAAPAAAKDVKSDDPPATSGEQPKLRTRSLSVSSLAQICKKWSLCSPDWLWDTEKNFVWKIGIDYRAISYATHDPKRWVQFLIARGQSFQKSVPRPVYLISDEQQEELKKLAKALIIEKINVSLTNMVGLTWLEAMFKTLIEPYSKHAHLQHILHPHQIDLSHVQLHMNRFHNHFQSDAAFTHSPPISTSSCLNHLHELNYNDAIGILQHWTAQFDFTSIEPSYDLHVFLPEISTISTKARKQHHRKKLMEVNAMNSVFSPPLEDRQSNPREEEILFSLVSDGEVRCNYDGEVVITQMDILNYVWLRLIDSGKISMEYCAWSLSCYISVLQAERIKLHPALSVLLIHVLSAERQYLSVSRLLQSHFFPDSSEIALAALELADIITVTELNNPYNPVDDFDENTLITTTYDLSSIEASIRNLQQVGLDMLWRCQERVIVIRWLLGHGRVMEAINLCIKNRSLWKSELSCSSIPAPEFFIACIQALQLIDANSHGSRIELMQTIYNFIRDWDSSSILVMPSGKSKLAMQCVFPTDLFDSTYDKMFREMFGFIKTT